MTFRLVVRGIVAIVALTLLVGMIEIASLASERGAMRAARASLFTEAVEPELPVAAEVDDAGPAENTTLTF